MPNTYKEVRKREKAVELVWLCQKGFTFIELVVVAVLSTLASIAIPVSASFLSLCYR